MGNYSNKNCTGYGEEYISEDFESTMTFDEIYKALDEWEEEIAREDSQPKDNINNVGNVITIELDNGPAYYQITNTCKLDRRDFYLLSRISDEGVIDANDYLLGEFVTEDYEEYFTLIDDEKITKQLHRHFRI